MATPASAEAIGIQRSCGFTALRYVSPLRVGAVLALVVVVGTTRVDAVGLVAVTFMGKTSLSRSLSPGLASRSVVSKVCFGKGQLKQLPKRFC
jgi:hypothetical protein